MPIALAQADGDLGPTLALIVGVGIAAQWIAARFRLPALVLLLFSGLALGPFTGVLRPDQVFGDSLGQIVSLAVGLVLFEGGLALRWEDARRAGPVLWRLIAAGLILGSVTVALFAQWIAGLEATTATVLGAILVVTGPTVILPLLRQARIGHRPTTLLKWEGIVNDPLGALLAVVVFQLAVATDNSPVLQLFVLRGLLAASIAIATGVLLGTALKRGMLPEDLKIPTMLVGAVLVHTAGEAIGSENGLLATTLLGVVLANIGGRSVADLRHFKEQVNVLLVSFLFIVLSARIRPEDLQAMLGWPLLLIAVIVLVVRPLVAAAATIGSSVPLNERLLLAWVAPRGVVAAAVAGGFAGRLSESGSEDANLLVPIVFGVVVVTVLQGAAIGPLARKLGLSQKDGKGVLVVGASRFVLEMARAMERAGAQVTFADTRFRRASRARRRGFDAFFGDVLSEEAEFELQLERVSWVFAATDDDAYNALVCIHYARELGPDRMLQLTPEPLGERRDYGSTLVGRSPWGERGKYRSLARAFWTSQAFKVTKLTEEFTAADLRERSPDLLILFSVLDERVSPCEEGVDPPVGAKVVYLESVPIPEDDPLSD